MVRKMAFAILAFALGSFGVSRVGWLPAKVGAYGAVAWAQDSDDSGADVVQPERGGPLRPTFAGPWCGSINDSDFGPGTISLESIQRGEKLSGRWSDTLGGDGTFNGKIELKEFAITATLKERGTDCKSAMVGTFVGLGEVTGTYSIFGCHHSDGGTFDITSPSC